MKFAGIPFVALAASLFFFSGCDNKLPQACFQPSENLVDQNEDVTFSNCSIYQEAGYEWDFGDGTTSTEVGDVHKFTSQGEFLVKLTSKGKTASRDDVYSEVITVGKRMLNRIEVTTIPATDGSGNPWDAGDAADVVFLFIKGGNVQMQTIENTNLGVAPPYNVTFTSTQLDLTPDVWTVAMVDMDGAVADTMASMSIDLNTFLPNAQQTITEQAAAADWILHYTVQ